MNEQTQTIEADPMQTRRCALGLLDQILCKKLTLDQALERCDAFKTLPAGRDKGFTRMLVTTILRRKGQMDDLISRAMDKGQTPKPVLLQHILYIGICQILFMDVPDHAAVDTAVNLAYDNHLKKQSGFLNAVLRRMTSEGREWVKRQDPVQMNIPAWLLKTWIADYGLAEAAQIGEALLSEAPLDITVKTAEETDIWGGAILATILPTGSLRRISGGHIVELSGFEEGHWWVQDASAALPVKILNDVMGGLEDKAVIDLCAAPGGKTMQLASLGAQVTALDRSAARMRVLQENLARVKLETQVEIVISDGAAWQPKQLADAVLIDAPCSATGTIRRHPDLLSLKTLDDVARLAATQSRLLDNAVEMVGAGGVLVYCTCSLQKSEGEEQVEAFLTRHYGFERLALSPVRMPVLNALETAITPQGDLRILPHHLAMHGGMDGFFVSVLQKRDGEGG